MPLVGPNPRRPAAARTITLAVVVCALLAGRMEAADKGGARVSLLPAGPRASILIELDDAVVGAAAIEATDNRTVAVEIGPVRGKILNQLLQATDGAPLVSQVRVRGVTHGVDGTLVTVHVTAKEPIIGSVRRSAHRVYIDLAPRGDTASPSAPVTAAATPPVSGPRPVPPSPTAPAVSAVSTAAATRSAASAGVATGGATAAVPLSARIPTPAATSRAVTSPPSSARSSVAESAPSSAPSSAPASTPSSAAAAAPAAATTTASTAGDSLAAIEGRASQLVSAGDVKGVERLKRELQGRRTAVSASGAAVADIDALLLRVDQFVLDAQRNRLSADAALFRRGESARPAATAAPRGAAAPPARPAAGGEAVPTLQALRPDLERVAQAAQTWSGGKPPSALVTLSVLLPKLRDLRPPARISQAHSNLCASLDQLVVLWASASANPPPEGTDHPVVERARVALDEFLTLERSLTTSPTSQ